MLGTVTLVHMGHHFFPILHTLASHWKLETSQSGSIYTTEMGTAISRASPYLCSSHSEQTVKHLLINTALFEWTPGDGDGQGGLAGCDSWGCKESGTTEQLIWSDLIWLFKLQVFRYKSISVGLSELGLVWKVMDSIVEWDQSQKREGKNEYLGRKRSR